MENNNDITFDIKEQIGVLSVAGTGWTKELNLIAWNGGAPKYDIREWSPDHDHMSRGVTLKPQEMRKLVEACKDRDFNVQAPAKAAPEADLER